MSKNTTDELDEIFRKLKIDAVDIRASCTERKNWEDYNSKYNKLEAEAKQAIQAHVDKKVRKAFLLEVPYTLTMKGNGSFIATWKPEDPIKGLPEECHGTSSSEGYRAINMLYLELVERGVIEKLRSEL